MEEKGEIKMEELTFEEIVKNFKPTIVKSEFELTLEFLKMTEKEFFQKYRGCTTQRFSLLKTILIKAQLTVREGHSRVTYADRPDRPQIENIEFETSIESMGYSKT
jgi:hypothetical protein